MIEKQKRLVEDQFAIDYNCSKEDFLTKETLVTHIKKQEGSRKFFDEDSLLNILTYNGKLVISAGEAILPWCENVLKKRISAEWCFEIDSLIYIDQKLSEFGYKINQVHLFFLPKYSQPESELSYLYLSEDDISKLEEDKRIDEAFLFDDYIRDVLGVAVISDTEEMLAVAGASNNSDRMWELGYNSFEEEKGYGKAALSELVREVIKLGKVPYCGTAISHLSSQNVALRAGMVPGFAELRTVKIK
jgi:hypothetical protein